jgi:hypothetical protein
MAVNLRVALLYLPESGGAAIVAPMHVNSGGIYFEQDEPLRIDDWRTPSQLIPALRSALECFSPRERNLREVKRRIGLVTALLGVPGCETSSNRIFV